MVLPKPLLPLGRTAAIAALSFAVVACGPTGGEEAGPAGSSGDPAAVASTSDTAPTGLPTKKDQVSYMLGMDIGRNLEPIKEEIDVAVVQQAIADVVGGRPTRLNDEQMQEIAADFAAYMQEKNAADAAATAARNQVEGQYFLAQNGKNEDVTTTESGLQYKVLRAGDGPRPTAESTVKVHYVGTLLDGSTFDSSVARNEPAVFNLQQVVPGWTEGLQRMPVGSKYRLWVPGDLGYGAEGTPGGPIPPNATLVFDVELLEIID